MVEWITGICDWFVENQDGILAFITSADFVAMISMIVLVIRQTIATIKNTTSTNLLNGSILSLDGVKVSMETVKTELLETQKKVAAMGDALTVVGKQLELFFEAQAVAYSTHRNEDTRANLMRIINEARSLTGAAPVATEVTDVIEEPVKTDVKTTKKTAKKTTSGSDDVTRY